MKVYDPEALKWRLAHRARIAEELKPFLDKVYRRSRSEKSRESKLTAMSVFCGFLRMLPNQILGKLRAGEFSPYKLLDDFISYLVNIGVAPHTIKDYVSGVKKWMLFNGVELSSERLREVAELPRMYVVTRDRVPSKEELRQILMACDLRGKALIATLASSGMRIGEVLNLRVKDIDFSKRPVTVFIRPEIAKDRQARYAFISDEAAELLKTYLGERINNPESYIFQGRHQGVRADGKVRQKSKWKNKPMTYYNAVVIFNNALRKAGLDSRDEGGRRVIHIHTLRKFFFTQLLPILGREITQALMGHKEYLDNAYRRFTLEQLGKYYLKAMPYLTFLSETMEYERMKKEIALEAIRRFAEALGIDPMKVRIEKQRELGREPNPEEEIQAIQNKIKKLRTGNNDPKKIVNEKELERYLAEGWDVQLILPSGKIIIRRNSV